MIAAVAGPGRRARTRRRPDFVAGNTRLRARLDQLLSPAQLAAVDDLAGPEVIGWLRGTAYGRYLPDGVGDPAFAVLLAAQQRQRDVLAAAVGAYAGAARDVVTALLCRHDAEDLVTLVRSVARAAPAGAVRPLLHGVGRLAGADLAEVVATDPGARVARLAGLRALDDTTRQAVRGGAERFERTGDLPGWEASVAAAVWSFADGVARAAGRAALPGRQYLDSARDVANLVTALRLRTAGEASGGTGPRFLPAGEMATADLERIAAGAEPDRYVPAGWRAVVRRHLDVGDLPGLARELEARHLALAARALRSGDPLGAAVPVGYVARVQREVTRVRLAASSASSAGPVGEPAVTGVPA